MQNQNLNEKYEEFHKDAVMQTSIINSNNLVYRPVLPFIDKYLQPDMKVLDIGCGLGTVSLYIANKGNEVLGIDISEKALDAAQRSADFLGVENITFQAGDFFDAEFQEKFDFVIAIGVLEHLVDDSKALWRINQLMNPGAILYLMVTSKKSHLHRLRMAFLKEDSFDISVGHLRRYLPVDLTSKLEEQGLSIVEIKETESILREFLFITPVGNKILHFPGSSLVLRVITVLDNLLAKTIDPATIYIVARKRVL